MEPSDSPPLSPSCRDALGLLGSHVQDLAGLVESLRAAQPTDIGAAAAAFEAAAAQAESVRGWVGAAADRLGRPTPVWQTGDELAVLTGQLEDALLELDARDLRRRADALADALAAGRFVHPRTGKPLAVFEPLRQAAVGELRTAPPVLLPGPADPEEWLRWVWADPATAEERIAGVAERAPNLAQLVAETDSTQWAPGVGTARPPAPPAPVEPTEPTDDELGRQPAAAPEAAAAEAAAPAPSAVAGAVAAAPAKSGRSWQQAQKVSLLHEAVKRPAASPRGPRPSSPPSADRRVTPPPPPPPPPPEPVEDSPPAVPDEPVAQPPAPATEHRPVPAADTPAPSAPPATPEEVVGAGEVVALCAEGEYLRAALLAAARTLAGVADPDPGFDALLAAHHVTQDSRVVPWPTWCADDADAERVARAAPESARLVFLAARCHAAEGGDDPLPGPTTARLLAAFNDLPEIRSWLTAYLEAAAVPGLWEQICRREGPDPAADYKASRAAFAALYESGLQFRPTGGAYAHRQDYFLSRKPAARMLADLLKPGRPAVPTAGARQQISAFLAVLPEAVTDEWVASTERVSGTARLRGGQRAELVRRAGEYLAAAARAWKAATALLHRPPQGDADRRRGALRELLSAASRRAAGQPWRPLFSRLTQGLTT